MSNTNQWREKYLVSLDEQEKLEKRVAAQSELLKRLVTNLSALAAGQDSKVDKALLILKDKMRGASGSAVHDHVLVIEALARQFDQIREGRHKAFGEELKYLLENLGALRLSGEVEGVIKSLKTKLGSQITTYTQYVDLLKAVNHCHKLALQVAAQPDSSVWQRLSGKTRLIPASGLPKAPGQAVDSPNSDHQPNEGQAEALHEQLDEPTFDEVSELIKGSLKDVLAEIDPAEQVKDVYHQAKARLEHDLDWHGVLETIDDVRDVLRFSAEDEDKALQAYLLNVNKQLQEICVALGITAEDGKRMATAFNVFGQAISDQVTWMQDAVKASNDIDGLKRDVSKHLHIISQALDKFREEQQASKPISEQLSALIDKVKSIEAESSQTKALLDQERHKATHDPLTELHNRQAYNARVKDEWQRFRRYGHPLTMAVCDVDHFKRFNDTYGHQTGDRVLKLVAKAIKQNVREVDFVARYGGEEFVILLPETAGADALQVVEKMRKLLAGTPFRFKNEPVTVTLSFGLTEFTKTDSAESVFHRADQALYAAKEAGRNRSHLV